MDWVTRIPAEIAKAERLLDGEEYLLVPPHADGNDTKLTLVLTRGEVALAGALWAWEFDLVADEDGRIPDGRLWPSPALREFTEKIGGLDD